MGRKAKEKHQVQMIALECFRRDQVAGKEEVVFNDLKGPRKIDVAHKHDFFIINLFGVAKGLHRIDGVDHQIGHKQIHVLFPDQVHTWDISECTIGFQIMVEKSLFEKFAPFFRFSFTNYQKYPVIPLSEESFNELIYEFTTIKKELERQDSLISLIRARASVIAAIISREAELVFDDFSVYASIPKLARFNYLIDLHYKVEKTVRFYAEELHITSNYLNVLCKKGLNTSATNLIYQRITTEAKRLLSVDLSVKEIAFDLGFADHACFSNFFKKQTGFTPTEFKKHV